MGSQRGRPVRVGAKLLALVLSSCLVLVTDAVVPNQAPIRIDCGSAQGSLDPQGLTWSSDAYYGVNGTAKNISQSYSAGGRLADVDATLRSWSTGDSCYRLPALPGRYLVRVSFAYDNYDNQYYSLFTMNELPVVGVAINEYFVEAVAVTRLNVTGYYTDYIVYSAPLDDVALTEFPEQGLSVSSMDMVRVCLVSRQGTPYVNSLQVLPVDTDGYFAAKTGPNVALSNWARRNSGSSSPLGPETNGDAGYRTWDADTAKSWRDAWSPVTTTDDIIIPSSYSALSLPPALFQAARRAGGVFHSTGYNFTGITPVDPNHQFMVVLYFAEIEKGVLTGERVMDVWVNGESIQGGLDVMRVTTGVPNTAVVYNLQVPLMGDPLDPLGQWVAVLLRPYPGLSGLKPPLICGVEVFEIIPSPVPASLSAPASAQATTVRIDCGGEYNYTDSFGLSWVADYGYTSGTPSVVVQPGTTLPFASSLRYFSSAQNCYNVPVPNGRYLIRLYLNYGNYDALDQVPTFEIAVESTIVVAVTPVAPGAFQDVLAYVDDGAATVCLLAVQGASAPAIINALEILGVDKDSYSPGETGGNQALYNYFRINSGGAAFGEGVTAGVEMGHRQWASDVAVAGLNSSCTPACLRNNLGTEIKGLKGANTAPDFLPPLLFSSSLEAQNPSASSAPPSSSILSSIKYDIANLDPGVVVAFYLHFIETNPAAKPTSRVFSAFIDGQPIKQLQGVDIFKQAGLNAVLSHSHVFRLATKSTAFSLVLKSNAGSALGPTLSGMELYKVVPQSTQSLSVTVETMQQLGTALGVPESASWQGDPCTPVMWKGVVCSQDPRPANPSRINSISLAAMGLNGSIPAVIGNLSYLTSLNLSHNALVGPIPKELTHLQSLSTIDLSFNKLNSTIPPGFNQMPSLHQLLLNDNFLMGTPTGLVPTPAGIAVDLSNNPFLCGADGFPSCDAILYPPPPGSSGPVTAVPLSSPPPPSSSSTSGGANVGLIIGIVLGSIALLALIVGIVIFLRRGRRTQSILAEDKEAGLQATRNPYSKTCTGAFEVVPEEEFEGEPITKGNSGVHYPF